MKKLIAILVILTTSVSFGAYTHTIGPGDKTSLSLDDHESLLMTGGELYHLNLSDWSSARIEDTAPLTSEGYGGIWRINVYSYAVIDFLGGEVHEFELNFDSRTTISGGRIDKLFSDQNVGTKWVEGSDPPVWVPDPHIEIVCRSYDYNSTTKILTGTWMDWSTFNIQLVDVPNRTPAIDNIFFTPEPASLLLFAAGAMLIRKR